MRKLVMAFLAIGISFSFTQPAVLASSDEEVKAAEKIKTLSIEDVVERGLEKNSVLLLLEYQTDILYNQKKQTELDRDETQSDLDSAISDRNKIRNEIRDINEVIEGLPGQIEELEEALKQAEEELEELKNSEGEVDGEPEEGSDGDDGAEDQKDPIKELEEFIAELKEKIAGAKKQQGELPQAKESLNQAASGLASQIEALEDAVDQLRLAIKKLGSNEIKLSFEVEETELMMELMLKSNFVKLLSSQEQQKFAKEAVKQVEDEFNMTKRRVELGLVSEYELEKAGRELDDQTRELKKADQDFQREIAKLALDLDITYNSDIKFEPLDIENPRQVKREKTIDELINESYSLKKAKQDLQIAQYDLDHMKEKGSQYEINQASLSLKVQEETIRQLKVDLKKEIEDLYIEADKAFEAIGEKNRNYNNAERDHSKLKKQFELGLLSKFQYEQAELQVKQTKFEREMAEVSYYMVLEQIKALENGLIQVQTQNG